MAYQGPNRNPVQQPTAGKINRTPAPDAVDNIRSPTGVGQGQAGPQNRSWCLPGTAVRSPLAQNLAEAQADSEDVLSKVISGGIAGRDDKIPADGNTQTRTVSAEPYKSSWGMDKAPTAKLPGAK
jgi:hypothetical protein